MRLREAMRPYTRELMTQAHAHGQPVMRGMFHEFPDDPTCCELADQYMFGPDLLVAPVLEPHATSRLLYLPVGASWSDLHDGQKHDGGQWLRVEALLHTIPVFRRDEARPELVGRIGGQGEPRDDVPADSLAG